MIISQQPVTRNHCRMLFGQFLELFFRHSEKYYQNTIEQLLKDAVEYELLSGRQSAREMLTLLINTSKRRKNKNILGNLDIKRKIFLSVLGTEKRTDS